MKQGQMVAGKYRLNRVLGAGGMATVWSATNVFTEREFAIKFLLPHVARTPDAGRRFLLEAKVSARIDHPNIIEIIDVGQAEDGALFLVMELLTGMALDEAVRSSVPALAVRDFLVTMRDVALALAVAHRRGVIHRDLKPSNIFLHRDRDGHLVAKVLDFGVSKILDGGDASLTIVGTVLGSPLYMSPEQALGAEGIDQRTDVFAFGTILFEALCGERPYSATNLNALIVAIATTQPKAIDDLAPALPVALRALIRDCLVTEKARRIASFEPIVERLTLIIDSLAESDLQLPARDPSAARAHVAARGGLVSLLAPDDVGGAPFLADSGCPSRRAQWLGLAGLAPASETPSSLRPSCERWRRRSGGHRALGGDERRSRRPLQPGGVSGRTACPGLGREFRCAPASSWGRQSRGYRFGRLAALVETRRRSGQARRPAVGRIDAELVRAVGGRSAPRADARRDLRA